MRKGSHFVLAIIRIGEKAFFYGKMRGTKTALKSGSSPLALPSFPKLLTPLQQYAKALTSCLESRWNGERLFLTEKCECIFLGSRTSSLSRSSGETLAVQRTELSKNARDENRFEKRFFSPRTPLFPETFDAFAISAKALFLNCFRRKMNGFWRRPPPE